MSGIDDWFLDYAHRHELTPGFSPDDDIPDPFVLGEIPSREWTVPSSRDVPRSRKKRPPAVGLPPLPPADKGGSWQSAARKWLAEFPERTNRECQRALRTAGHRGATTKLIARLRESMPKPAETQVREKTKTDQTKSVRSAGGARRSRSGRRGSSAPVAWHTFALQWLRTHPGASNREWQEAIEEAGFVGVTAPAVSALRATTKAVRNAPRRATKPPRPQPTTPSIPPRYCEACGLAVSNAGRCRC